MAIRNINNISPNRQNQLIISIPKKEVTNLVILYAGLESQPIYYRDALLEKVKESDLGKTTLNNSYFVIAYGGSSNNYTSYETVIEGVKEKIGTQKFNKIKNYYLLGFSKGGVAVFNVVDKRNDWVDVFLIDADCSSFTNSFAANPNNNKFNNNWTNVCGKWSNSVSYGCGGVTETKILEKNGKQINETNLDHLTIFTKTFSDFFTIKETIQSNAIVGGASNVKLYIYLAWQQGSTGLEEHLKIANGKLNAYSQVKEEAIRDNWPGGFPNKQKALNNYSSNPQVTARLFLETWSDFYNKKREEGLNQIRKKGKNRTGVEYTQIQNTLSRFQVSGTPIDTDFLTTLGWIENALNTDTDKTSIYQTIFQMRKNFFPDILNKIQTKNFNGNFIDYPNLNEYVPDVVDVLKNKYNSLKRFL